MLTALIRAFDQLGDPRLRRVVWLGVLGAALGLVAVVAALGVLLDRLELVGIVWLDRTLDLAGGVGAVVLAILAFPGLAGAISSLLLDRVADAVEQRYYPQLGPGRSQSVAEAIGTAAKFFLILLLFNLLGLVVAYWVPGLNAVVFLLINGYLLGREYFELVALRRIKPKDLRRLRSRHGPRLLAAGVILALLMSVPLLNLLVPVIGTAFMVHIHQQIAGKA